MEKVIIRSDEAFYEYCKKKCIGDIQRVYNSQWCDIYGGKKCEFGFDSDGEWVKVPQEPIEYPCIFVWDQDCDDAQRGMLVYESDFAAGFKHKDD